jgi:hypothetical protein
VYLYAESVSKLTGKPIKAPTPKSEAYRGVATQLSERSLPTMFAENPTAIRGEVDGILENADRFKELKKFLSKDKDAGGIGREVTDAEVTRYLKRLRRRVSTYVDAGSGKDYKYMRGLLRIGDDLFDADRVIEDQPDGPPANDPEEQRSIKRHLAERAPWRSSCAPQTHTGLREVQAVGARKQRLVGG